MDRPPRIGALLLAASTLAACSGGVPSTNYPGDFQLVIDGEITSATELSASQAGIAWCTGEGETPLAVGTVVAFPLDTTRDVNDPIARLHPGTGVHVGHWIVYLARDVQPGTLTAWWLGDEALERGYHVMQVTPYLIDVEHEGRRLDGGPAGLEPPRTELNRAFGVRVSFGLGAQM